MNARRCLALGLLSAAAIAFQLALMQILSISQWHHFAYMIISVAMLGFGAAGTFLTLFRKALSARFERVFPTLMFLCGAAMAACLCLSQHPAVRFDSYLLFLGARHAGRLALTYMIFLVPFFLAALAVGLAFTQYSRRIGVLYFWNLAGSGLGGLLALGLMWFFSPSEIPAILALIPVFSGLLAMRGKPGWPVPIAAVLSLLAVIAAILYPPEIVSSEFKSASRLKQLPGTQLKLEKNSPYGFMQVFSSAGLRYAPGLSLIYPEAVPVHMAVFNNGDWVGPLLSRHPDNALSVMDYSTAALPYALKPRGTALILDLSTGAHAHQAVSRGVERITAVEANPVLLSLLADELAGAVGDLTTDPALTVLNACARSVLQSDIPPFDLIIMPTIDAFGGVSGLNAIQERYLFTREAFRDAWGKLTPRGVLSITCWMDYPPRHPLRVLSTLVETLQGQGVENPRSFIAAVRSWGAITFMVKRTPFDPDEITDIRAFSRRLNFDPALLPDVQTTERSFYNVLQDDLFFRHIDQLLSPERESFYDAYDFDIRPVTDDRPYFSQSLRWKSLSRLSDHYGKQALPFFEIGYLVVFLTLLQASLSAALLILVPLLAARRRSEAGNKAWIFFYFSGIGMGYLFVEIAMIQRFVLYLGNPIHAAAVVIGAMLFASGAGSYASARVAFLRTRPSIILFSVIVLLLAGSVWLTPVLLKTIGLSPTCKLLISLCALTPAAFLMGIPFPVGVSALAEKSDAAIPWAWGINGCFSVVSASLATIIVVEAGFTVLMLCAALAYGGALAAGRMKHRPTAMSACGHN
jgi:hypothetical protein